MATTVSNTRRRIRTSLTILLVMSLVNLPTSVGGEATYLCGKVYNREWRNTGDIDVSRQYIRRLREQTCIPWPLFTFDDIDENVQHECCVIGLDLCCREIRVRLPTLPISG
ncbi:uncharacterized protein LOC144447925 [Glandiceps talaboti]